MKQTRRDVIKTTGGALVGYTLQSDYRMSKIQEQMHGEMDSNQLLANCWMHSGGTTPFRGAHGQREWSPLSLERRAQQLSNAGFSAIGLYHSDIEHQINNNFDASNRRESLQQMKTVLEDNGINYVMLEFLVNWILDEDDPRREAERETRELLLETADVLGADHIKIGNINGYPREVGDIRRKFADISGEFAQVDTQVGLEFFPVDPNVNTIADAMEITEGIDNGGLYLDLWHNVKMDIDFNEIANLTSGDVVGAEFQDGYIDTNMSFIEETINLRKIPGEGEFPISDWISATRESGFDEPFALEILSEEYRRLSVEVAYQKAHDGGSQFL